MTQKNWRKMSSTQARMFGGLFLCFGYSSCPIEADIMVYIYVYHYISKKAGLTHLAQII